MNDITTPPPGSGFQWWYLLYTLVLVPLGGGIKWIVDKASGGSATTINVQNDLMRRLSQQNDDQAKQIAALSDRINSQSNEIRQLKDMVSHLLTQLEAAGAAPKLPKGVKLSDLKLFGDD